MWRGDSCIAHFQKSRQMQNCLCVHVIMNKIKIRFKKLCYCGIVLQNWPPRWIHLFLLILYIFSHNKKGTNIYIIRIVRPFDIKWAWDVSVSFGFFLFLISPILNSFCYHVSLGLSYCKFLCTKQISGQNLYTLPCPFLLKGTRLLYQIPKGSGCLFFSLSKRKTLIHKSFVLMKEGNTKLPCSF